MPLTTLASTAATLPFLAAEHAGLVNSIPYTFGQINADGLFPTRGLDTPFVRVDLVDGVITALPVTEGGRPSSIARAGGSKARVLEIPNISHEDSVLASDVRSWQALAARSRNPEETLVNSVEERHRRNRLKFDITLEVMRMGALQGVIKDGAGTTLYDLYEVFGLTQRVVYFDLDNTSADVPAKIEALISGTEDALIDEVMTGVEVRVDPIFYDKLIKHASIAKFYQNTPLYQQLLNQQRTEVAGQFRRSITLAGVTFKEYRSKVKLWGADTATKLIGDGLGYANPVGTVDTHATFVAPPLDIRSDQMGDPGDLIHMTEELMKHGAGLEWKYQANALPIWKRPALLTKVSTAAA
jgi:hypothetical protein